MDLSICGCRASGMPSQLVAVFAIGAVIDSGGIQLLMALRIPYRLAAPDIIELPTGLGMRFAESVNEQAEQEQSQQTTFSFRD